MSVEAASAKPPKNAGKCTIEGSARADTLHGTRKDDVICGLGGGDRIVAADGRDVLRGGGGADLLKARDGDDALSGGGGDDDLYGQDDDDKLVGGNGADLLDGGDGNNSCRQTDSGDLVVTTCWMGYRIDNVSIVPPSVDTWMADREVHVAVRVVDTRDGPGVLGAVDLDVHSPSAGFESPVGEHKLSLVDGDAHAGTWAGSVTMPRYSTHGTHTVSLILREYFPPFTPGFDARWHVSTDDLRAARQPHAIDQTGPGDSGAPAVASLDVNPRVADTSSGPVEVEFTARIVDDVIGTNQVNFALASPTDPHKIGVGASLISGTVHDGVWRGTWTFQPGYEPGAYGTGAFVDDGMHFRWHRPHELEAAGLNVRFEVR